MRNLFFVLLLVFGGCRLMDSAKLLDLSPGKNSVFTDFAVGDFNNDGRPDFAAGEWSEKNKTGSVSIYINGGNGIFAKAFSFKVSQKPVAITVGDFDSDGLTDIAYVGHPWFFYVRTGKSKFGELLQDMAQDQWSQSLAWGKLQKKGISDFLCGPVWRRWNNDDSFSHGYFSTDRNGVFNGNSIITDTDCDGNQDIVFYNNFIRILYGPLPDIPDMKMKNNMARYYVEIPSPREIKSMSFEDVDGDGITDIAAIGNGRGLMVFRQHLHGFDPAEKPALILPDAEGAFCFEKDFLIYSDGSSVRQIKRSQLMTPGAVSRTICPFSGATKIISADINSDDSPELLLLSPSGLLIVRRGQTL